MEKYVKQVIVVRKDIKNRRGKEIAQGSHASMAFLTKQIRDSKPTLYSRFLSLFGNKDKRYTVKITPEAEVWMNEYFTKVCVSVEDEAALDRVYAQALSNGLTAEMIVDAGKTDAGNGKGNQTKTCIAIGPNYADNIDKITGKEGTLPCKLY